jgi:hypothetical protein
MSDHDTDGNSPECSALHSALLTAEPAELRGEGSSELARHLSECADCRALAEHILQTTSSLAARLQADVAGVQQRRRARTWHPAWTALPAAAALAGLLLIREVQLDEAVPRVGLLSEVRRPVVQAVVNAPGNRDVAVFKTKRNIIVVWDLGARGKL